MEVTAHLNSLSTDTYFSFILQRPLAELWSLLLLALARLVPTVALSPFLGGKVLADPMKIGFAVVLVPFILPYVAANSTVSTSFDILFIFLMVKEVMIGGILGFMASIPFFAAQGAGILIDHQSGSQSLQVTDPSSQTQSSPTGLLYNNVMLATFFMIGGPLLFFEAVFTSYKIVPVDQFINASFFVKDTPLYHLTMKIFTTLLTISLQLSAPSLIALLMSDLFLGIANRMAPQVQISFLLWSMKSYVGIALLWAGWWFILKQIDIQSLDWLKMLQKLVENLIPRTG